MAVSNFYILTEEQYLKLINGQAQHHTLDADGLYHTDKISVDLLDDTNSTKKLVTAAQIARWNAATLGQGDWEQTDPTAKDYIKNKPSIPYNNYVLDVLVSTDGINYSSIVNNYIANLDLSNYLLASGLKTINGKTIVGSGNILIDELAVIDCTTAESAAQNAPTSPNTSGKIKIVVLSPTTVGTVTQYNGYWYAVQKQEV